MRRFISLLLLLNMGFAQSPSEAMQRLLEGNKRYTTDKLLHPNHSSDRREEITSGQNPFATILGCSDSRVAPEIIFDQGLGDLFTVRVAGNVVGDIELNSIDYSVKYLGSSLILVLGHESCGAVTAVMKGQTADIEDVANLIKPAIQGTKTAEEAIKANVRWFVSELKKTKFVRKYISEKKLDCIGAYYHLGTGEVEILN